MMFSLEKQQKFIENKQKQEIDQEEKLKKTVVELEKKLNEWREKKEWELEEKVKILK